MSHSLSREIWRQLNVMYNTVVQIHFTSKRFEICWIGSSWVLVMIVLSVVQSSAPTRIHNAILVTDTSTIYIWHKNIHSLREMPCLTIIAGNVFMDVIFNFSFDTDNCCKISLAFSNFRTYKSAIVYTPHRLHRCRCRSQHFPRRVCLHRKTTYVNILSTVLTDCF